MQNDSFEHSMSHTQEEPSITASLVLENRRLEFLPAVFGPHLMIAGEALVYRWLERPSADYRGAYWHYYKLSNGGFYMAPDLPDRLHLTIKSNWFKGDMSADASGIVATLLALGQLADRMNDMDEASGFIERYCLLHDFAAGHVERRAIYRAVD